MLLSFHEKESIKDNLAIHNKLQGDCWVQQGSALNNYSILQSHLRYKLQCLYIYMCGLDYESILNPQKKEENKKFIQDELIQKEFTKAMEGPGGYFLEPGGYIVDKRNTEN
jgi:hypothetical protein